MSDLHGISEEAIMGLEEFVLICHGRVAIPLSPRIAREWHGQGALVHPYGGRILALPLLLKNRHVCFVSSYCPNSSPGLRVEREDVSAVRTRW